MNKLKQKGMTLIECIVVIVILSLLSGVVAQYVHFTPAKLATAKWNYEYIEAQWGHWQSERAPTALLPGNPTGTNIFPTLEELTGYVPQVGGKPNSVSVTNEGRPNPGPLMMAGLFRYDPFVRGPWYITEIGAWEDKYILLKHMTVEYWGKALSDMGVSWSEIKTCYYNAAWTQTICRLSYQNPSMGPIVDQQLSTPDGWSIIYSCPQGYHPVSQYGESATVSYGRGKDLIEYDPTGHSPVYFDDPNVSHCQINTPDPGTPAKQGRFPLATNFSGVCVGDQMKAPSYQDSEGTIPTTASNQPIKRFGKLVKDTTNCLE